MRNESPAAPRADDETADRSTCREDEALDQQLSRQADPRRAKSEPYAQLVPAPGSASQQQVRDVDARDHQHEQHDNEDREERTRVDLPESAGPADGK